LNRESQLKKNSSIIGVRKKTDGTDNRIFRREHSHLNPLVPEQATTEGDTMQAVTGKNPLLSKTRAEKDILRGKLAVYRITKGMRERFSVNPKTTLG